MGPFFTDLAKNTNKDQIRKKNKKADLGPFLNYYFHFFEKGNQVDMFLLFFVLDPQKKDLVGIWVKWEREWLKSQLGRLVRLVEPISPKQTLFLFYATRTKHQTLFLSSPSCTKQMIVLVVPNTK